MPKLAKVHTFNPAIAQKIITRLKSAENYIAAICANDIGIDLQTFKAELIRLHRVNMINEPAKELIAAEDATYTIGGDLEHEKQTILLSMTDYADEWLANFIQRTNQKSS